MKKKYGAIISDEEISLAINSAFARSQNQLHIHISCIRSDVKLLISQNLDRINDDWSLFPGGILGHAYVARRISLSQLEMKNAFQLLANDLPEAKNHMNEFGLGLVAVKEKNGEMDFIMLADRRGFMEEIQDHQCSQLYDKEK
jgi:CDP-diacylglycerol pyrophosphatase